MINDIFYPTKVEAFIVFIIILLLTTYAVPSLRIIGIPFSAIFLPILYYLVIIRMFYKGSFITNKPLMISTFLLYFSMIFTLLFAREIDYIRLGKMLVFLSLPLVFYNVINSRSRVLTATKGIIVVGLILCTYGYYGYFTGNIGKKSEHRWKYYGIHYTMSTRNSDIYFLAIPLIILFSYLLFKKKISVSHKISYIALCLILSTAIALSFVRGMWVSLFFTFLILLYLEGKMTKLSSILRNSKFVLIFAGISTYILVQKGKFNYFLGRSISIIAPEKAGQLMGGELLSNYERIEIIRSTFSIILENPLGIGVDNLRYYYPKFGMHFYHPENAYLQILAEYSVIGFIGGLILILYPTFFLWKQVTKSKDRDWLSVALLSTSIFLAISFLFNVFFFDFYIWIIYAIIWSNVRRWDKKGLPQNSEEITESTITA